MKRKYRVAPHGIDEYIVQWSFVYNSPRISPLWVDETEVKSYGWGPFSYTQNVALTYKTKEEAVNKAEKLQTLWNGIVKLAEQIDAREKNESEYHYPEVT